MYTKVDENWQPIGLPSNFPIDDDPNWVALVLPPPRTSEAQTLVWEKVNGQCVGRWIGSPDPLDRLATHEEINARHRELEISPIQVGELEFDCDEKSEIRMRDAIAFWDFRPLQSGVFEDREIEGQTRRVIVWTLADNSTHALTKTELSDTFTAMLIARSNRGAVLFSRARKFKSDGITLRQLLDMASWGV